MIALSEKQWKAVFIAGGIILLILLGLWLWAYSGNGEKEGEHIGNIGRIDGNAEVKEQIANEKANTTNQTLNNLNAVLQRDSNSFTGNSTDKFCGNPVFQCDSTCENYRRRHSIKCR